MTSQASTLPQLLAFVASHDMENPRIEGDAVVFGVVFFDRNDTRGVEDFTVRTVKEARDALGY